MQVLQGNKTHRNIFKQVNIIGVVRTNKREKLKRQKSKEREMIIFSCKNFRSKKKIINIDKNNSNFTLKKHEIKDNFLTDNYLTKIAKVNLNSLGKNQNSDYCFKYLIFYLANEYYSTKSGTQDIYTKNSNKDIFNFIK